MLVIFGSARAIYQKVYLGHQCTSCGEEHAYELTIYQRYLHILFIPCYPMEQEYYVYCKYCGDEIYVPDLDLIQNENNESITAPSAPKWTYSGCAISIIALIAILIYFVAK